MEKKHLSFVVAIIAVASAWFIFGESPQGEGLPVALQGVSEDAGTKSPDKSSFPVVLFSKDGFTPKTLEVSKGETVVFLNTTDEDVWVAGPPHPTHHLYPGFDAEHVIGNGETYEFMFGESGQWTYHNHVHPSDFGVVIVR